MRDDIVIRGAREHNLANIDVTIPRDRLVVITGVSGSGKSSLAFDTLFAEGQRRYVESLSAYARQFLDQMEKPDVDTIEGLSPAISIEQKTTSRNPRSTVGTVTEIHDYLRLLWASIGIPMCPDCGVPIRPQTVEQMVDQLLGLAEGTRFMLLAPLAEARKGEHRKLFSQMVREGFVRARVDGEVVDAASPPELEKKRRHTVEVVIDRLSVRSGVRSRLADSLETALRVGDGLVRAAIDGGDELVLSARHSCPSCGYSLAEVSPRLFSFNSPQGACPECSGLGFLREVDPEKLVLDPERTIAAGCLATVGHGPGSWVGRQLEQLADHLGFDLHAPWRRLPEAARELIMYGSSDEHDFVWQGRKGAYRFRDRFEGVVPRLERRYKETASEQIRRELERYMSFAPCHACGGARLRPESLAVKVAGASLAEVSALSVRQTLEWFDALDLDDREAAISAKILREVRDRLGFLVSVGLDYLTLDRMAGTLSGGESQRIRLATQVGSKLMGVLYVLDEPSIGLHQRDNRRLLSTLKGMRDLGNTVVVVEHDEETIRDADWVIDLGPGAGRLGGEVVAAGPPERICEVERSLTGAYLSGRIAIPVPPSRANGNGAQLIVRGAAEHNLKDIDVRFPLGRLICVTGVSGSGKSTLVNEVLHKAVARRVLGSLGRPGRHRAVEGVENLDKIIAIDQSPIGRTPRSNPATYTKVFDPIRSLFAATTDARARGYKPGRFSFNVKGGRCESCQGAGQTRIEMHFLPDVFVTCEACNGRRYNRETLEAHYKGLDIAEILDLTVSQARDLFAPVPQIVRVLDTLVAVGLDYLHLGQPATTLSGGEAQRIKLSRELAKRATGKTLYLLDEPTTGLHFDDVRKLLLVLHALVDRGNTVIVIEHNLDVIKTADWIVDLGPEGGDGGGRLVAEGTPEQIARCKASHTGRYLKPLLERA
ncbi:MAG: excinuclease ABC subunit UvrA [Thermoanaerobaculales bacterium]|jgi:excinuclease ABC subunit A|nr:excinuclease ABC subunit UvrA [Thermoanaerobaculales bacterium]